MSEVPLYAELLAGLRALLDGGAKAGLNTSTTLTNVKLVVSKSQYRGLNRFYLHFILNP
jgi:hypothetical protein